MNTFELEEYELCRAFNAGEISDREYRDGIRVIADEIRGMAERAAEESYWRELERW